MSGIRLYVDASEHAVVKALRQRNIDVLTASEVGHEQFSDDRHLAFAASERRSLYSFNARDYARLHAEYLRSGRSHAGIILIPGQRYRTGEKIRRLSDLVTKTDADATKDTIWFL